MRGKRQGKKANCEERAQSVIKPARKRPQQSNTACRAGRPSACHRRSREVSRDGRHGEPCSSCKGAWAACVGRQVQRSDVKAKE